MSYSQYVAQSVCCTVSMLHSQYVAQSVCRTVSLSHSQYVAQSVCRTVSMSVCLLRVTGSAVLSQYVSQFAGIHCVAQSACCTVSMSHSQYVAQYVTGDRFRSPLTVCFTVCRHSLCRTVSMSYNSMFSMLQMTGYPVLSQYVL